MICASVACRLAAIRNTAVRLVSAPQSIRRSPRVFHPVSSMFTTNERLTSCSSRVCGAASASPARWTIASTAPVESSTPNSSRASSVVSRRETRLRIASGTTAAWRLGCRERCALRAANPVQPVLGHPDRDRRQLRDLTPRRLDHVDALRLDELVLAQPAPLGPVLDELVNPPRGKQPPMLALMPLLPAALT